MNEVRRSRAAGTFWLGMLTLAAALACALLFPAGRCSGMTEYNGYMLPDPPEYDAAVYPYAIVQIIPRDDGTSIAWYRYSTLPFVLVEDNERITNKGEVYYTSALVGEESWTGGTYNDEGWKLSLPADTLVWSNFEVKSGMMDCSGYELPILPDYAYDAEHLPYATILRRDLGGNVDYFLYLSEMPMVYDTERENPPSIINDTAADCEWLRYSAYEKATHWETSYYSSGAVDAGSDSDFGEYGEVIWCNYEMVRIDKAPVRNLLSHVLGYLAALCGPVLSMPEKQPTAYSYNGVVLPKLPEVPDGYNNICLFMKTGPSGNFEFTSIFLYLASSIPEYRSTKERFFFRSDFIYYEDTVLTSEFPPETWGEQGKAVSGYVNGTPLIWTNVEILDADTGSPHPVTPSNPEPIYE